MPAIQDESQTARHQSGLTGISRQRKRRGEARRTAVYQAFGQNSRLLYVGMSCDPERRLGEHRRYSPWWPEVVRVDEEWFDNQWIAADVKTYLVRTSDPVYNIQCRGGPWQCNRTRGPHAAD
jgi:hypothetical protein